MAAINCKVSKSFYTIRLLFSALWLMMFLLSGCASQQTAQMLAVVNGEPVTEEDLRLSLNIAHRKEKLTSAGSLDMAFYLQKLIDDKLVIQEARRMGIEERPEIQKAIKAFILRESVTRLFKDEIAGKISLTEKDITDYYKKNYEKFTISAIELGSEEDAKKVMEQLKSGEDFRKLMTEYSANAAMKEAGEFVALRQSMGSQVEAAVLPLKPGEYTGTLNVEGKYLIIKLISRQEASEEEFDKAKPGIERAIRKAREKERGDEYLKYLRGKAPLKIHSDILSTITSETVKENIENLLTDKRPLVEVYDSVLTVGNFANMVNEQKGHRNIEKTPEDFEKAKQQNIDRWIDFSLVDHEALSRHYEKNQDIKEMIDSYENQLLKDAFIKDVIIPRIKITDEALKDYYRNNQKSYLKPAQVKIQQIIVKNQEDGEEILKNLRSGADFSWLAKNKSIDPSAKEGVEAVWQGLLQLPANLQDLLNKIKPGETTPVFKFENNYAIVKLVDRSREEAEDFDTVKNLVIQAYFEKQFKNIFDSYVGELRKGSEIKINEEALKAIEEKVRK